MSDDNSKCPSDLPRYPGRYFLYKDGSYEFLMESSPDGTKARERARRVGGAWIHIKREPETGDGFNRYFGQIQEEVEFGKSEISEISDEEVAVILFDDRFEILIEKDEGSDLIS